jgi:hypothetical protein
VHDRHDVTNKQVSASLARFSFITSFVFSRKVYSLSWGVSKQRDDRNAISQEWGVLFPIAGNIGVLRKNFRASVTRADTSLAWRSRGGLTPVVGGSVCGECFESSQCECEAQPH